MAERRDGRARRQETDRDVVLLEAQRRANRLQTAAEISRAASSLLSLEELLPRSVELIRERFDLYYVGIFLLDQDGEWAILEAGSGEAGQQMLAAGHRLRWGSDSMIGQCVASAKPRIALDVGNEAVRFDNPVLPETKSEMALPLISRNRVIGAMTIQSELRGAFSQEDITILQTMADQLANAIQNARLFDQMDRAVRENETLYHITTLVGEARTVEDLVHAALDVATFLGLDTASLGVFTRWDDDDVPVTMDVYELSRRERVQEIQRHSGKLVDRELFDWCFADPQSIFASGDIEGGPLAESAASSIPEHVRADLARRGHRALIVAPLRARGRIQGVLALFGAKALGSLPESYVQIFARSLIDQVASVLDRQFLMTELERRASYLAAAADVSRAASSFLDQGHLLSESVTLIRQRFDLEDVGIYLVDDVGQWAVLGAESNEPPQGSGGPDEAAGVAPDRPQRVPVDRTTSVGVCIFERRVVWQDEAVGRSQVSAASEQRRTHSELALPLVSRGEVIGAMVVRSGTRRSFSEADVAAFRTLADQLANAVRNAQLYEASQENLEELQRLQRRYALEMWGEYLERQNVVGYEYDLHEVTPLAAGAEAELFDPYEPQGRDGAGLMETLSIRDEPVGLMTFAEPVAPDAEEIAEDWSKEQMAVLAAVREQLELALENRLLIDRSQRSLMEARQREAELAFLQEVSAFLNAINDVVAARQELLSLLQGFVPVDQLTLVGYDSEQDELTLLGGVGDATEIYRAMAAEGALADSGFASVVGSQSISVIGDLSMAPPDREAPELVARGIRSRLLLPLQLGYRVLGVLELGSVQPDVFDAPGLLPILQQVAAQVASALERGNLLRVAQASASESRTLYEATSDLAEAMHPAEVLAAIARHAFPSTAVRAEIGLYLADPTLEENGVGGDGRRAEGEPAWLEIVASLSTVEGVPSMEVGTRMPISEMPSLSFLGVAPLFVSENVAEDPRIDEDLRAAYLIQEGNGRHHSGALLIASLATGVGATERIGVLRVRFEEPLALDETRLRLYRTVSDQAAVVLSNRQLFQESQERIERQAAAVELANLTTSLSERQALLQRSVDFLAERACGSQRSLEAEWPGLYFVGIFLLDAQGEWAVLRAATGEIGERLLAMGHRVQVSPVEAYEERPYRSMVARCIQESERVLALDIDAHRAALENPLLPDTRSAVVFPLISRGQIHGAISLQSDRRFAFTQDDIATLALMVNQLANVIESTNLYERSQRSLAETRMLYRIAQQITDARDAEAVLKAAVEGIAQREEPDFVIAGLLEPQQAPTELRIVEFWDRDAQRVRPGSAPSVSTFPLDEVRQFYEALRLDERFVTPDITQDPLASDVLRRTYAELGLRATAAFQLSVRETQYGTIMVHSRNAREFSTAELSFYENVARQAFVALENIRLVEATQAQAERRDILNQVLQTASSSLDQTVIMREVGAVISERLDMPVMVWECASEPYRGSMRLRPVAIYAEGGRAVRPSDVTLPAYARGAMATAGGNGPEGAGPQRWGDVTLEATGPLASLYDALERREPVHLDFAGAYNGARPRSETRADRGGDGHGREILDDAGTHNGEPPDGVGVAGLRLAEGYAVPLVASREGYGTERAPHTPGLFGVIVLGRQPEHGEIDEAEREFMRTACANISIALETASLYRNAQETAEKLKEVDELKNQFMANMSHELRTPLNSIIGFSRVMLKGIDGPLTDVQKTDLSAIYDSGRHLLNLINDILDISKINAGKMEVAFEPVDLGEMIKSVMSTALGFVKDKPIRLLTDVPEDLPKVVADGRRVRQVLTNLLGNAGKFTEEGHIKVSASYDDYQVLVRVEDTGIGIPPDRIHAVFEQFEQVDSTSTRRYGGTGLGIPLSREFVRMHGGDMWVQDTVVGQGTVFCFSLPIGGPDSARASADDVSPVGRVVLAVDDDPGVITLFRRYLTKRGYRVFGLTNPQRAVAEAKRLQPHAITLDVILPDRSGWEILEELKSDPDTRDIPVIMCSVLPMDAEGDGAPEGHGREKGLSMGVADYLVKPISERALLDALERIGAHQSLGPGYEGGSYVLVVDDNPEDRKLLRRILEAADYEVTEAEGGAEAIGQIHAEPPKLVILDLMMPDVDGFVVLENIKSDQRTRQIPVVIVTAKELDEAQRERLQRQAEALVEKGLFDQEQLLDDVRAALDRFAEARFA
ncbi:MAG: GAF domain-containing protein [Anaerolineae bacterium]